MLTFHHTCIGFSHLQSGKPCQDASFAGTIGDLHLAIVSDGHGGHPHPRSAIGAQFAVETAKEIITTQLSDLLKPDYRLGIFDLLVLRWKNKVAEHYLAHPLTEQEEESLSFVIREIDSMEDMIIPLYGCTLMAACVHPNGWFAFQIGDGTCVVVRHNPEHPAYQPLPLDEKCFLYMTSSLCDHDAVEEFRFAEGSQDEIPYAIFLGSDGIDNSFGHEEAWQNFYMDCVKHCSSRELIMHELEEALPKLSEKGRHDDMSVAAIVDSTVLDEAIPEIFRFQIQQCEDLSQQMAEYIHQTQDQMVPIQAKLNCFPDDKFLQRDLAHQQTCLAQYELGLSRTTNRLNRIQQQFSEYLSLGAAGS